MSSPVPYVPLKDLCTVNQGLQIPISSRFKQDGANRYFYITVQFLKDGFKEKYYIENPPASTICNEDDIIVVRTGSTGQILTGIKGCFHNNFFKVTYDISKLYGAYLYYCLTTKEKQREMKQRAGVTVIPDLNHFMFLDIKIPYLELGKQKQIAFLLDSISNKIELNNRINAELEAMAKTLYDYWFVQFDFPNEQGKPYKSSGGKMVYNEELKREIPEGWEVKKLKEVLTVIRGASPRPIDDYISNSGLPWLKISDATKSDNRFILETKQFIKIEGVSKTRIVEPDTLILSNSATPAIPRIMKIRAGVHDGWLVIKDFKSGLHKEFMYHYFKYERPRIINLGSGSIFKNLKTDYVKDLNIILPPELLLDTIKPKFHSISEKIYNNTNQNQQLASLRDWLLPMLMNGQVTVQQAHGDAVKEAEERLGKLDIAAEPESEYKIKN